MMSLTFGSGPLGPLVCIAFYLVLTCQTSFNPWWRKIGECHLISTLQAIELDLNEYV